MASLSDIMTTAQNIAQGINQLTQTYLNVQGANNRSLISTHTLIKASPGRIASISVTTAGSTTGAVYDAATATATTPIIYVIPQSVSTTPYVVNLPTTVGIVVAPGTGQVLTVSWS